MDNANRFRWIVFFLVGACLAALAGCADPETKKAAFLERGSELYEQGDYVKARLEFKNAIQIDTQDAEAYFRLGETELKLKSYQQAYGAFSKAAELAPDKVEYRLALAKLLVAGRALDRASAAVGAILEKDPGNAAALLLRAKIAAGKGDVEEARQVLDELVGRPDPAAEVYWLLALLEAREGRRAAALDLLDRGISAHPKETALYSLAADLAAKTGRVDKAVEMARALTELAPGNAAYALALAGLYWRLDRRDEAGDILARLKRDEDNAEKNTLAVARFFVARREYGRAEKELLAAARQWPRSLDVRLALAELYAATGRAGKGIEVLEDFKGTVVDAASPQGIGVRNALAGLCLSLGRLDEAEKYVDEVIGQSPSNIDAHFLKGSIRLYKNDAEGAVSDFRTVVSEKPDFARGYLKLAEAYVRGGQKGLARDILNQALESMPKSKDITQALVRLDMFEGKRQEAESLLRKLAGLYPGDAAVGVALGDFYAASGDEAAASRQYEAVKKAAPASPLPYLRQARLYLRAKQREKALVELRKGLEAVPRANVLLAALVSTALRTGDFQMAEDACLARMERFADDAFAINLLGKVYAAQKKFDPARARFEQAAALRPLWPEPHANLAKLYLVQGKKEQAIAKFRGNIERNPDDLAAYLFLGLIHEQSGETDEAAAVYDQALRRNPSFWAAANNLAYLLAEHGDGAADLERARSLARRALDQRPDAPEIMDTAGWVYYKRGELGKARVLLRQGLEKAPDSPELNYHMAVLYKHDGLVGQAVEALKKALESGRSFAGKAKAEALLAELEGGE